MIISHRHKFIFIHVPKTAGSTVSAYLAREFGPWDVQLGSWKDALGNGAKANRLALIAMFCHLSPLKIAQTLIRNHSVIHWPVSLSAGVLQAGSRIIRAQAKSSPSIPLPGNSISNSASCETRSRGLFLFTIGTTGRPIPGRASRKCSV